MRCNMMRRQKIASRGGRSLIGVAQNDQAARGAPIFRLRRQPSKAGGDCSTRIIDANNKSPDLTSVDTCQNNNLSLSYIGCGRDCICNMPESEERK
jgi:hypothetical protein